MADTSKSVFANAQDPMFCYQCEQAAGGKGCTKVGVCGKDPNVAAMQDLLIYALKGLSQVAQEGRKVGIVDPSTGPLICSALFSTLTNVNYDNDSLGGLVRKAVSLRDELKARVSGAGGKGDVSSGPATFQPEGTIEGMVAQGAKLARILADDENGDIRSLKHTVLYGAKGFAAYADHARILGQQDDNVYKFAEEALSSIERKDLGLEDWVALVLKTGETNIRAMELLDAGNTGTYGHPVPTQVPRGPKKGHAIAVSGHDLKDLEEVLKQSEGKGINVYTHGEMLPTHGYPGLKKYPHFYGHYGTAWQNQNKEFAEFPGAILMTTNCLVPVKPTYKDNIFTTGIVGFPGVRHVRSPEFAPVIEKALSMPGFTQDMPGKPHTVGFARNTVMGVAGKVIEAVKNKNIRHFFLVAGCDGAKPGRNYYTEFAEKVPGDCVILTLACGKYRIINKDYGDIGGIPRLLDVGQCNDAYSAVVIAKALAEAFSVGVNDLPLSMVLSWYEQKAVAILLSLLFLGIRNIRLGPTLPAFVTPAVLDVLVKNFNIMPISTPDQDLKAILG
jgi:hydroxylamine reductase